MSYCLNLLGFYVFNIGNISLHENENVKHDYLVISNKVIIFDTLYFNSNYFDQDGSL